jgi:hypothetical protein
MKRIQTFVIQKKFMRLEPVTNSANICRSCIIWPFILNLATKETLLLSYKLISSKVSCVNVIKPCEITRRKPFFRKQPVRFYFLRKHVPYARTYGFSYK